VDQHAADERVRLEQFEAQVFGPSGSEKNVDVVEHEPPLLLSLNAREQETVVYFESEIRSWGFGFSMDNQVARLTHTPKIDTRVATSEDFREYLHLLHRSNPSDVSRVLRPPVITRLLHSRACRSAIMFGDYLSISQCQDILDQLSQCQLPFQCAHGRPSIVPLIELD
jgi:DNA mismatch repair protein MLH3